VKKFVPSWKRQLRREMLGAEKIAVLGVGNELKGDDAAGLLAAKALKKQMKHKTRSPVKVILGYETPENYTGEIRKFQPDLVLVLDAVLGGFKPGMVFPVDKEDIADNGVSTHKISLTVLMAYLEQALGCRVVVLGIQPQTLELGAEISASVKRSIENIADYLSGILRIGRSGFIKGN